MRGRSRTTEYNKAYKGYSPYPSRDSYVRVFYKCCVYELWPLETICVYKELFPSIITMEQEIKERMSGVVTFKDVSQLIKLGRKISKELINEGFEDDEIKRYLKDIISEVL